jgi:transposase-like protein
MERTDRDSATRLQRVERVRCLKCSATYVKPSGGGTVSANPGCPDCGYVGWVRVTPPLPPDAEPTHSFGDRLRRRTG